MKAKSHVAPLQERIKGIQREPAHLGPMRPGSLSEQYNVCGTPGCRCKNPNKPQKHGPYYHLNYTWRGKSTTRFIRREEAAAVREQIGNYKRFRELSRQWVDLSLELAEARKSKS